MLGDDPELLAAFLDESRESLDGLEALIVALDGEADVPAAVQAVFRPVHTFKGNAPFFGFIEAKRLAHALETVLDHLRTGRMGLERRITDALLAGLDGLRAIVTRLAAGGAEVEDAVAHADLIARLEAIRPSPSGQAWDPVFAELGAIETLGANLDPAICDHLARLRRLLTDRQARAAASPVPPAVGGGLRARLSVPLVAPLPGAQAEAIVAELAALRAATTDPTAVRRLDEAIATCGIFLPSIGFDDKLRQHVLERLPEADPEPAAAAPAVAAVEPARQPTTERRSRTGTDTQGKSMRVSEAAVDGFLAHVGDLLVIGDQLDHLQRRVAAAGGDPTLATDLRQVLAAFGALSDELQRSIMAVRRVAVRQLLQKAPRLVRDIATAVGKDIAVVLDGESVEVDKSRLDLLDGPLTHLVRNCADHGIEPPARRRETGKPERGTIAITASAADGWFALEIADDGRGLDLDAIRAKGERLGLVRPGEAVDEQAIVDLIFSSGLSTAAAVSDVSGRGVGMDVVKRNVTEAGGTITVSTRPGRGTTFTIRVPTAVTTQIVPAYLVGERGLVYALPLDRVGESFSVDGGGDGLALRHGRALPVLPLGGLLGLPGPASVGRRTLVTVERRGRSVALAVDSALGVRQVVLRPMPAMAEAAARRFQGAALLGDGRLALVLDLDCLLEEAASA